MQLLCSFHYIRMIKMWTSDSIQYVEEQTCTKHSFSFSILINFAFKSFETRMNTALNFHYYLVTFSKIKQLGQYHNPSGILYSPTHSKWYHRVLHFVLSQATISPTYCVRQWHSSASSSVDSSSSVVVWESALEGSSILCLQKKKNFRIFTKVWNVDYVWGHWPRT